MSDHKKKLQDAMEQAEDEYRVFTCDCQQCLNHSASERSQFLIPKDFVSVIKKINEDSCFSMFVSEWKQAVNNADEKVVESLLLKIKNAGTQVVRDIQPATFLARALSSHSSTVSRIETIKLFLSIKPMQEEGQQTLFASMLSNRGEGSDGLFQLVKFVIDQLHEDQRKMGSDKLTLGDFVTLLEYPTIYRGLEPDAIVRLISGSLTQDLSAQRYFVRWFCQFNILDAKDREAIKRSSSNEHFSQALSLDHREQWVGRRSFKAKVKLFLQAFKTKKKSVATVVSVPSQKALSDEALLELFASDGSKENYKKKKKKKKKKKTTEKRPRNSENNYIETVNSEVKSQVSKKSSVKDFRQPQKALEISPASSNPIGDSNVWTTVISPKRSRSVKESQKYPNPRSTIFKKQSKKKKEPARKNQILKKPVLSFDYSQFPSLIAKTQTVFHNGLFQEESTSKKYQYQKDLNCDRDEVITSCQSDNGKKLGVIGDQIGRKPTP